MVSEGGDLLLLRPDRRGEKVIFTDTRISHTPLSQGDTIIYSPVSGLEASHEKEIVRSFHCRMNLTPQSVLLKDYNYRKPSLDVSGSADVDARGRGQVYSYGDHIRTPEEGNRIAKIKAEGLLCRKEVFHGEGSVPYMMPGYTFTLKDHYRGSFNQSYLVTDVSHEGNQTGYLLAGITMGHEDRGVYYRNSFSSIVSTVQFRPEHDAEKPRISGTLTAKIDASASGQYAELDTQGRYTVIVPFDTSGRKDGKASAPIRMAQPYAGSDHGMHFPLHKGTEVLLTFIDGDPDRPIIQAAVPNPETQSPVNVNNQTMSAITTAGGNKIHIEDQAGSERILMHSPEQKSFIRIGAPNDPSVSDGEEEEYEGLNLFPDLTDGISKKTKGFFNVMVGGKNEIIGGAYTEIVMGFRGWITVGALMDACLGGRFEFQFPEILNIKNTHVAVSEHNLKSYASILGWWETRWAIKGQETRVAAQVNLAIAERKENALEASRALAASVEIDAERVKLAEKTTQTNATKIEAIAANMQTIGNKLKRAGDQVKMAGTKMEEAGAKVSRCAGSLKASGTTIKDSGVATEEAATVITQV